MYIPILHPVSRQHIDTKQVSDEKNEFSSDLSNTTLTKHVDLSEENVDKACLSDSTESIVHMEVNQMNVRPVGEGGWSHIPATEARIADVREISPETEASSLDIPVVTQPVTNHHDHGANSFYQP